MAVEPLSNERLAEVADQARSQGRLGLDTEFVGEGRYRPLLCLVQLAVAHDEGTLVELVDPLDPRLDPVPLAAVLADPAVEIVLHAGRQDVALLRRSWRTEVRSIFDTQIAAGFAGFGAQTGYEGLLRATLGVKLAKTASFTRWDTRPLSAEQAGYAREDVVHLLDLADALRGRLAAAGRLDWALEECKALEEATDERDEETVFERLPRIASLSPAARAVARELVTWRERTAAGEDRPVATILSDVALVEVAKRRPSAPGQLEQIRGVNPGTLRRRAGDILAAVARGRGRKPIPSVGERRAPPDPADAALIALCEALVRARALEAGLAYELVASRADLQEVVTAMRAGRRPPDIRTLRGWRRALAGDDVLELLRGRLAVALATDGPMRVATRRA